MSGRKGSDNPGLCPTEGQESGLCSRARAQNQFLSMSEYYKNHITTSVYYVPYFPAQKTHRDFSIRNFRKKIMMNVF